MKSKRANDARRLASAGSHPVENRFNVKGMF